MIFNVVKNDSLHIQQRESNKTTSKQPNNTQKLIKLAYKNNKKCNITYLINQTRVQNWLQRIVIFKQTLKQNKQKMMLVQCTNFLDVSDCKFGRNQITLSFLVGFVQTSFVSQKS